MVGEIKMNRIKKEKGITLVALAITISVMLVLISIAITGGSEIIKNANLENLKTNLLLVKAKAKEVVENAAHELGPEEANSERLNAAKEKLNVIGEHTSSTAYGSDNESSKVYFYSIEGANLKDSLGIDGLEGTIVIKYDLINIDVEVYSSKGFVDNDGQTQHSLTEIQEIEL